MTTGQTCMKTAPVTFRIPTALRVSNYPCTLTRHSCLVFQSSHFLVCVYHLQQLLGSMEEHHPQQDKLTAAWAYYMHTHTHMHTRTLEYTFFHCDGKVVSRLQNRTDPSVEQVAKQFEGRWCPPDWSGYTWKWRTQTHTMHVSPPSLPLTPSLPSSSPLFSLPPSLPPPPLFSLPPSSPSSLSAH